MLPIDDSSVEAEPSFWSHDSQFQMVGPGYFSQPCCAFHFLFFYSLAADPFLLSTPSSSSPLAPHHHHVSPPYLVQRADE